jgi:hypothetical protein
MKSPRRGKASVQQGAAESFGVESTPQPIGTPAHPHPQVPDNRSQRETSPGRKSEAAVDDIVEDMLPKPPFPDPGD